MLVWEVVDLHPGQVFRYLDTNKRYVVYEIWVELFKL